LGDVPIIRCIGLASHASTNDWTKVARALKAFASALTCKIHLRLLTWGEAIESFQVTESRGLNIEVAYIFDRPASIPQLGELLLVPDTVDTKHRTQLLLELQGSPMRVFRFKSVFSPTDCAHDEDLLDYIRALVKGSGKKSAGTESSNTTANCSTGAG
jgi:hypothetical protein